MPSWRARDMGFIVQMQVHRTVEVMVMGVISYCSRSPRLFVRGSMTTMCYVDDVLQN